MAKSHHSKRVKHEFAGDTQRLIVMTAHRLFMQYGYRAVTTRRIAQECGLTQPAMYHYFADKPSLYMEVLYSATSKVKDALTRIVEREPSAYRRLVQMTAFMLTDMLDDLHQMFHDIKYEMPEEVRSTIERWWRESYLEPIAGVMEQGMAEGVIRTPAMGGVDASACAYLLLSMIRSATFANAGERKGQWSEEAEAAALRMVGLLLHGIGTSGHPENEQAI